MISTDLLLPVACIGCRCPGTALCPACGHALGGPPRWVVPRPAPPDMPPCAAVAPYSGVVRSALIAYKEHGRAGLVAPLGAALARAVLHTVSVPDADGRAAPIGRPARSRPPPSAVLLVPLPSRSAAVRRRGTQPVLVLARYAARCLRRSGWPCGTVDALTFVRRVRDSAGLSAGERRANLAGAMAVRSIRSLRLPGGRESARGALASCQVVLVDDLVTTGVSLAEGARVLRVAGWPPGPAATVAATRRVT